MANLNMGCDFSAEHIQAITYLAAIYNGGSTKHKLTDVYGSPGEANPFGSVRKYGRETMVIEETFKNRLTLLRNSFGIKINLAFNSVLPHKKHGWLSSNCFRNPSVSKDIVEYVKTWGPLVDYWILASPLLVELFHKNRKYLGDPNISISTIMNVHSLPQVKWIAEHWPLVKKICPALWRNRDMQWLTNCNAIIPFELLVNEFCSIDGVECEGLYRQACYLSQSVEATHWNPMETCCIASRQRTPWSWLQARYILPQWLDEYENRTGIDRYKITGRTHKADYIIKMGKAYLDGDFDGNLLELWGQLQATLHKDDWEHEQKSAEQAVNIPTSMIPHFQEQYYNCCIDDCGVYCRRCEYLYKRIVKELSMTNKDHGLGRDDAKKGPEATAQPDAEAKAREEEEAKVKAEAEAEAAASEEAGEQQAEETVEETVSEGERVETADGAAETDSADEASPAKEEDTESSDSEKPQGSGDDVSSNQ